MADVGVQKLGTISAAQLTVLERESLLRAQSRYYFNRWVKVSPFEMNEGIARTFTRFTALTAATTALNEGEVGLGEGIATSTVTVTPNDYGSYMYLSSRLVEQGIFDPMEYSGLLGEQAFLTVETLTRNIADAGGSAQYAGQTARASITSSDIFSEGELIKAICTLQANKALPFAELGMRYPMIIHPHVRADVVRDPGLRAIWENVGLRSDANPLFGEAVGAAHGVMFFVSDLAYLNTDAGSGNVDVYYNYLL